ncbi:MAG: cell division protein SepF [Fimbriimonadales bacterium]|nr:cell division protein SepF [Fimbriimonadales bacterium]
MEEMEIQERPGFFQRLFGGRGLEDPEPDDQPAAGNASALRPVYRYNVTVRRQVFCFEDALAAANGLKRGEQQILNLSGTDPVLRQKIVDFMAGVNYAQEGTWEEIGEHIYLVVPPTAYVEIAPPSTRSQSFRN